MSGPMERYASICADLEAKRANAARRNKPTMWAYYHETLEGLRAWFAGVTESDGGYAGAALALHEKAVEECPTLPPYEAARLWALGVYARRLLASWDLSQRVSLDWLHQRAEVAA